VTIGLVFIFAIYKSETTRFNDKQIPNQLSGPLTKSTDSTKKDKKEKRRLFSRTKKKNEIYVSEISGDTLDVSKDKFIMILADRFKDENITYGVSIWYDNNTCAWSPGTLRITILDKEGKPLKSAESKIGKELEGSCQQLEELNIFMGDLIFRSYFINAEFTDEYGVTYYQWRKRLREIYE